jgi:DNA mismatch endonuclease, patch repair protein
MDRKSASFTGLRPASVDSSNVKRRNRRTDTKHELLLRRELWRMGLRFRKNVIDLPGKPDIVFPSARIAVFCDGDFWHGRRWEQLKAKLKNGTNGNYWVNKITSNIERDSRIRALLETAGWRVIRIWEMDIKRNTKLIASEVKQAVDERTNRSRTPKPSVGCR